MASVNVSNGANGSPPSPSKCCESVSTKQPCIDLSPDGEEEESLQQLMESEFALRIAASKETPPDELLVGLQTADFFSTTQYESPSDEIPPSVDPFDPFTTTVEQSPTFTGFLEDELKEFNQSPLCDESLSFTQTKNQSNGSIIPTSDVDLLSGLDPIDTEDLSPSPTSIKETCDLVQDLNSDSISNHITKIERDTLELALNDSTIDTLTKTIDVSPSPLPLELQQLKSMAVVLDSKPEQIIDLITQTIDLSPTPPLETQYSKEKLFPDSPDQINSYSPIEDDPINKTIDLSPSPPVVDKLKEFEELDELTSNSEEIVQEFEEIDELFTNKEEIVHGTDEPSVSNEEIVQDSDEPVVQDEEIVSESVTQNEEVVHEFEEIEEPIKVSEELIPIDIVDPLTQTIDLSPSPPAADTVPDDTSSTEVTEILQDYVYRTFDLSPSPPVENGPSAEGKRTPNVEIKVTEHSDDPMMGGQQQVADHFAPPVTNLEIAGFETWTVAGTEEEEEEAPPMQKSLLPERPMSLPHVVCADTTNIVDPGVSGEEIVTPSSEEPSTPSAETTPAKKKTSKKTKSSADGKTKKSKKTRKCEEKENISVAGLPPPDLLHEIRAVHHDNAEPIQDQQENECPIRSPASPMTLVSREELGNVSVKDLSMKFARGPSATQLRSDMDELEGVSLRALREMYISEASKSFNGLDKRTSDENLVSAISISSLRRSFGDLSTLTDAEAKGNNHLSPASDTLASPMNKKAYGTLPLPKTSKYKSDERRSSCVESPERAMRARSFGDLSNMPYKGQKETIVTGVSVKALLASYCSLVNFGEEDMVKPRSRKPSIASSSPSSPPPQVKSSFSKFDALSRKSGVLHVRSSDAAKAQQHFSQGGAADTAIQNCRACGTQVFQMEQVKAEKSVWHKNCFRCKECNKQLTVDAYGSNEGQLYCKPHFKDLFKPKAVAIEEPALLRPRRLEMIIRENQPQELPPDVVRASDKPDLGLEELTTLNVKSRYQLFERSEESTNEVERSPSNVNVKRSPSILSKLARFQAKGMDVGVTDDSLNGIPVEQSSSESEEESNDEKEGDDSVVKSRVKRERPVSFGKMDDVRSKWATGQAQRREEQREERKEEVQKLRSRLFMGKCGKVKEMYEQAMHESATTKTSTQQRTTEVRSEKARCIKERFEKGEPLLSDSEENEQKTNKQEDMSVFEAGISKKSRSLFLELDSAAKSQQSQSQNTTPRSPLVKPEPRRAKEWLSRESSQEVVRASDKVEEVEIQTADISSRFKFFEGYREPEKKRKQFRITPPREGQVKEDSPERQVYRDPEVVRADDHVGDEELIRSQTASRMLNLFRQMEEKAGREDVPEGPKPLKRFTPPPDYRKGDSGSSDEESDENEDESEEDEESDEETRSGQPGVVRAADKLEDDFLKQALSTNAARAKTLKAKFEQWETSNAHLNGRGEDGHEEEEEDDREGRESLETTSSLRARFESLSQQTSTAMLTRVKPKVNRFVVTAVADECRACGQRLYPMERLEAGGFHYHRKCFRCRQCNCILRLENFTVNQGNLYCLPHFRQLFIARGNYEEGFGRAAPSPPHFADQQLESV